MWACPTHPTYNQHMIHTPLAEVLKDAGFTPENFYIHPFEVTPADYHPVWHLTEGRWRAEREREARVTEKNEHKIDEELR